MKRYCYICGYETLDDNISECPQCLCDDVFVHSKDEEELMVLFDDRELANAMLELKKNNLVEYKLKFQQLKTVKAQQESSKSQNDNTPKCPTCGSTNIKKISGLSKAGSVAMWGIFSRKVHKQWHCDACGSEW